MKKSLIALVLLAAASVASALSLFAPSDTGGFPMATQSVSAERHAPSAAPSAIDHAAMQVAKDVNPISLKTADSGSGAESAYQAWLARQGVTSVHPGCGQPEPHPIAKKGGKGKGGGGKKCIDIGMQSEPIALFTSST